jgi:hypothetical protein
MAGHGVLLTFLCSPPPAVTHHVPGATPLGLAILRPRCDRRTAVTEAAWTSEPLERKGDSGSGWDELMLVDELPAQGCSLLDQGLALPRDAPR